MPQSFSLLHAGGRADETASIDGDRVRLAPETVRDVLGWELKPQGLCLGDVCVPVADANSLADVRGIDLAALAQALGLPAAIDAAAGAAAIGVAHSDRAARLDTLEAPAFSLPDLSGKLHSLADYCGKACGKTAEPAKKVLLIAYASW